MGVALQTTGFSFLDNEESAGKRQASQSVRHPEFMIQAKLASP
jgi:hypothetical protein